MSLGEPRLTVQYPCTPCLVLTGLVLLCLAAMILMALREPPLPDEGDCAARNLGPHCWREARP